MGKKIYVILFFSVTLFLFSCKKEDKASGQKTVVNITEAVGLSNESRKEFSFIAKPFRSSELSFRVGGPIDRLEVYAGTYYKQGSIIAEIDPRDFHIRKERAEAVYKQAKAEFERIRILYEKDNLSASVYEKAKADYTAAKTAYDTSLNELQDTKLIAPFNGYIGEVYREKFQDVKATQPVLSLIDIDQLKVEVYVPQDIALDAQLLETVGIRFDALPGEVFEAKIAEVSKATTRNNLSYLLTALLPNKDGALLAGMSGKVFFDVAADAKQMGVAIPLTALSHRPTEGDFVWVVDREGEKVNRRQVTMGQLLPGGKVSIIAGLSENEPVAVSGLRFLSDNMPVEIGKEIDMPASALYNAGKEDMAATYKEKTPGGV